ncbi:MULTISPECIES: mobilization protein [unclassified Chromohalobacter]|uniref:mobilization protein n=1 Tax=unclassified Chromohalobacter TaxID=2628571 RepID=UPI002469BA2C|nr:MULTISPECIES: mobilization protein [unclassified Chromohalobacter]
MPQHRSKDQQLADAEARVARLRKAKRSEDTRRKILAGSVFMRLAEQDDQTRAQFRQIMDEHLDSERDRQLFDLPPKA